MNIKQARAPIGRGRWDHSFKQNNPPALAAEAKQRNNNNLAVPPPAPPSSNRAGISKDFGEVVPPFPAASASGVWRARASSSPAALLSAPSAPRPVSPQPRPLAPRQPPPLAPGHLQGSTARVDGPPPPPSSAVTLPLGPGGSSLSNARRKAAARSGDLWVSALSLPCPA